MHADLTSFPPVAFEKVNLKDPMIAYLFGGIGDARHVFKTLLDIKHREEYFKAPVRKYHLTIVDINPHALARDLIVFVLLDDLSKQNDFDSEQP